MKKVNVLGVDYVIENSIPQLDSMLTDAWGYCDFANKRIILNTKIFLYDVNPRAGIASTLIQAFMFESGVSWEFSSERYYSFIDWISIQFPRITEAFNTAVDEIIDDAETADENLN